MIIDCKKIREEEVDILKQMIKKIEKPLTLAIIQIGYFKENELYLKQKEKLAKELGITMKNYHYNNKVTEKEIIKTINKLNKDDTTTGIMIQKPILKNYNYDKLVNYIDYNKDVDGLTDINQTKLENGEKGIIPCTALAVLKILNYYNIYLKEKKIAIIGKSNLVGKPLYNILKKENEVILCDSKTINIVDKIKNSEIVIIAVGKAKILTENMINKNHIIIDVGTNYLDNHLVGDSDFEKIYDKVKMITPVPGGVGKLTPVYLFYNLIEVYKIKDTNQKHEN